MSSDMMDAMVASSEGSSDGSLQNELVKRQVPREHLEGARDVLVRVSATAVNRIDCLQRRGRLQPPPGASAIIGVELAGAIEALGSEAAQHFSVGQRVMALVDGGSYAEVARVDYALLMPIDDDMPFAKAAAIPEVYLTAFQCLDRLAPLRSLVAERSHVPTVLVHAGASGVGTSLIQLATHMGARVVTTSSQGKVARCEELGAVLALDRRAADGQWQHAVLEATDGRGADVVVDFVGAPYFAQNLEAAAVDGYVVMLGFLGGFQHDDALSLAPILRKRLTIVGSTLRSRSLQYKAALIADFWQFARPLFADSTLDVVVDRELSIDEASEAHRITESNENVGKIVLKF